MNEKDWLNQAKTALATGGVIAIPTETVWGLAADATNPDAIQKIFDLKNRPVANHLVLQFGYLDQLKQLTTPVWSKNTRFFQSFWPGEITFVLPLKENVDFPFLDSTVGLRIPKCDEALHLLTNYKNPLTVTSLNRSGSSPVTSLDKAPAEILRKIDFIVPFNGKMSGAPSTIVDLTGPEPKIIRQGEIKVNASMIRDKMLI